MYLKRAIEKVIKKSMKHFPVVLITGPRQVGKTTLLREITVESHKYVTMDDYIQLGLLRDDPLLFFKNNDTPLVLDEIQYAPEAFRTIKLKADEQKKSGYYLLTGSQSFSLMKNVSESLAGRVAILELQGLSMRERLKINFADAFVPSDDYISSRKRALKPYADLWKRIHRGSMPALAVDSQMDWNLFYQSYVQTYIERDVRQLTQVGDEKLFMDFLVSVAARSGELLNYQAIAKNIGVSADTVKRWTSILETSGIIYLLSPYGGNHLKRAIKTPKVYFTDTGLLCYLTRWLTPETLQNGAFAGHAFETFVVTEVLKSFLNAGINRPDIYFYRDKDGCEIDLIIENGRDVYPLEIKMTASPHKSMAKNFGALKKIPNINLKRGTIICQYSELLYLKDDLAALPIEYI